MTWTVWLAEGRVETHRPVGAEIAAQRRAASRSLNDTKATGLSPEGRFQLAYGAALDLATIAVLASGHRVKTRVGHHQLTLEAAGLALGASAKKTIDFLDVCRRRRNVISYEGDEVGAALAEEIVAEVHRFSDLVEGWLRRNYPELL
jgi:hypothetical protein